jgi:hypothetical protein
MTSADPTPTIAALGIQPTYSAREAAVLLSRRTSLAARTPRMGRKATRTSVPRLLVRA